LESDRFLSLNRKKELKAKEERAMNKVKSNRPTLTPLTFSTLIVCI